MFVYNARGHRCVGFVYIYGMKNQLLIICLIVICFGCSRKSVPVNDFFELGVSRTVVFDTGHLIVETFKVGKGDTLFRKIVVDSSWVDVK